MRARLMYSNEAKKVILESMELKDLDQLTSSHFANQKDILSCPKYQKMIGNDSLDGEVYIGYSLSDLPISLMEDYPLNVDFFEEQKLDVVASLKRPVQMTFMQDILILLNDPNCATQFFEQFSSFFDERDRFYYYQGIHLEDPKITVKAFEPLFHSMFQNEEGYFFTRVLRNFILENCISEDCKQK